MSYRVFTNVPEIEAYARSKGKVIIFNVPRLTRIISLNPLVIKTAYEPRVDISNVETLVGIGYVTTNRAWAVVTEKNNIVRVYGNMSKRGIKLPSS